LEVRHRARPVRRSACARPAGSRPRGTGTSPAGSRPRPARAGAVGGAARSGLLQNAVDEVERQDLGQLTQMAGSESASGHGELARDSPQTRWQGTMTDGQRGSSETSSLGGLPGQRGPVARVPTQRRTPLPPARKR
jgi:hypothetical protein